MSHTLLMSTEKDATSTPKVELVKGCDFLHTEYLCFVEGEKEE